MRPAVGKQLARSLTPLGGPQALLWVCADSVRAGPRASQGGKTGQGWQCMKQIGDPDHILLRVLLATLGIRQASLLLLGR